MTNLRQDIQFGFRMLLKSRGLAAIAIFALALGIGANTAIFSVVNTVLLRALPYPQPDQLVWFWESEPGLEQGPFSAADFLDYQAQNQSSQQLPTLRRLGFNLTGQGAAERIRGMVATPNVFSLLGVHPILGRDFVPEEGAFGSPRRALLTYGFWQSHFAGDRTVVGQLLTESMLLSFVGGALGLGLAWGLVRLLVAASPQQLPRVQEITLDLRVLLFTLGVSLLTGLLFGLAPAIAATRHSLGHFLKEAGRGGAQGLAHNRLRGLLVVTEVAFSLVLLVCAGLLGRSFVRMLEVNPGFRPDHVVTMWMNFTSANYAPKGRSTQFLEQLLPRVAALPGVEGVAVSNDLPLEGDDTITGLSAVEGRAPYQRGQQPLTGIHAINPGYFQAMGIPLLRGREFSASDNANSTPVLVINQKLAETLWPGQDPLGKHFNLLDNKQSEVVGVVGNVMHNGLGQSVSLESYHAFPQNPWSYIGLAVRTHGDPGAVYGAVRSLVAQIDPELPVHDMRPMEQVMAETMASRRLMLWLVGAFAALALVLASVGIYGVMSYAVTERLHEIGVRMALGAQRRDVLRLVVGHGMRLAAIGLLLGSVTAFFAARAMTTLLFGIRPSDPLTYIGITVVLALAALAACYIPARRATAVDPMVALRYE